MQTLRKGLASRGTVTRARGTTLAWPGSSQSFRSFQLEVLRPVLPSTQSGVNIWNSPPRWQLFPGTITVITPMGQRKPGVRVCECVCVYLVHECVRLVCVNVCTFMDVCACMCVSCVHMCVCVLCVHVRECVCALCVNACACV